MHSISGLDGDTNNANRILVRKRNKRRLGKQGRRYEDVIGYEKGRWIELAQDRVQWRVLVLVL
jgi:hypothetical protein